MRTHTIVVYSLDLAHQYADHERKTKGQQQRSKATKEKGDVGRALYTSGVTIGDRDRTRQENEFAKKAQVKARINSLHVKQMPGRHTGVTAWPRFQPQMSPRKHPQN